MTYLEKTLPVANCLACLIFQTGRRIVQIRYVSKDDFAENVRDFEQRHRIPENEKIPITFSKE